MVSLEPIADKTYLYELAAADGAKDSISADKIQEGFDQTYFTGWNVLDDGVQKGVIVILKIGDRYILESFKDQKQGFTGMSKSVAAGMIALDYMEEVTDVIYAYAGADENGMQRLIKKLGFKYLEDMDSEYGKFQVYKKEMN